MCVAVDTRLEVDVVRTERGAVFLSDGRVYAGTPSGLAARPDGAGCALWNPRS